MSKKVIITASELHRTAGKILKRVALEGEHLIVDRDDYPIAVLLSYPEYEEFIRLLALKAHQDLVHDLGQDAEKQGLTAEQLMAELEEVNREAYIATNGPDPS